MTTLTVQEAYDQIIGFISQNTMANNIQWWLLLILFALIIIFFWVIIYHHMIIKDIEAKLKELKK